VKIFVLKHLRKTSAFVGYILAASFLPTVWHYGRRSLWQVWGALNVWMLITNMVSGQNAANIEICFYFLL